MIRVVLFQDGAPIGHPYCDSNGVMTLPVAPRPEEDIMLDGFPVKVLNVTWMLGAQDYDLRIDVSHKER